jgi:magnesium chelatase family protein
MHIYSFSPFGYEGSLVSVEVDLRRGIPAVDIVGLADGAVKESRDRMRAAICNSGFDFPLERVLISLSPADLKKEGAGFDLAIALAVLAMKKGDLKEGKILVMGELELSGNIRSVRGVHAAAATAFSAGIFRCIVPFSNGDEAREVSGMQVFAARNLTDAFYSLSHTECFITGITGRDSYVPRQCVETNGVLFSAVTPEYEYANITGQPELVRGLQIAAAGGHNLMAFGPPGCGKTFALKLFPALLPLLTVEEAQSVTRIYSLAGILSPSEPLMRVAPFRAPHQTATIEGMCGGGVHCRPGEISLAHNGVLFLDEALEFRSSVLQMLRVPLESGKITLSRAGRLTVYPASFQLLIATNPCPCGNYGSKTKVCLCSARSVELYWKKFSAPLLDRIDMRIHVDQNFSEEESSRKSYARTTEELRKQIAEATTIQRKRQGKNNAKLQASELSTFCRQDPAAEDFLHKSVCRYGFSPRAAASCLKIARTIADMAGSEVICKSHIEEAVSYRKNGGGPDFCV